MDFSIIERHPWATTGLVLGGGFVLFLVLKRGSSSGSQTSSTYGGQSEDPAVTQAGLALQAQQQQIQGSLSVATLQAQSQITLAQLGADLARFQTGASLQSDTNQTAASLTLGLSTLQAQLESKKIDAQVQMSTLDAIVAAFRGSSSPAPTNNNTPTATQPQPTFTTVTPPPTTNITIPTGTGGTTPGATYGGLSFSNPYLDGSVATPGAPIIPGYSVPYCDPRDVACVMNNQVIATNWQNAAMDAQATSSHNLCIANANRNVGQPNYAALVAACG
jgi:hypothetical protein